MFLILYGYKDKSKIFSYAKKISIFTITKRQIFILWTLEPNTVVT